MNACEAIDIIKQSLWHYMDVGCISTVEFNECIDHLDKVNLKNDDLSLGINITGVK